MIPPVTVTDLNRSGNDLNTVTLIVLSDTLLFSPSRDSVLRSGGSVRIRDTRQRSHLEVYHTELRRGIRVGWLLGRKRRFNLQTDQRLRYYVHRLCPFFLSVFPSSFFPFLNSFQDLCFPPKRVFSLARAGPFFPTNLVKSSKWHVITTGFRRGPQSGGMQLNGGGNATRVNEPFAAALTSGLRSSLQENKSTRC